MIRFKEVTLLRDELKVLDSLSFTIDSGELVFNQADFRRNLFR
jgi:hypothetical protein